MREKGDPILAMAFSLSSDADQAAFFNMIARDLFATCRGSSGFDNQTCFIARKLDGDGRRFIKRLAEYVELYEKDLPT